MCCYFRSKGFQRISGHNFSQLLACYDSHIHFQGISVYQNQADLHCEQHLHAFAETHTPPRSTVPARDLRITKDLLPRRAICLQQQRLSVKIKERIKSLPKIPQDEARGSKDFPPSFYVLCKFAVFVKDATCRTHRAPCLGCLDTCPYMGQKVASVIFLLQTDHVLHASGSIYMQHYQCDSAA